jgi:hypothetical protein
MKSLDAAEGVSRTKPAPSIAAVFVWHPAAAKLGTSARKIHRRYFRIVFAPFLDEVEGAGTGRCLLRSASVSAAARIPERISNQGGQDRCTYHFWDVEKAEHQFTTIMVGSFATVIPPHVTCGQ